LWQQRQSVKDVLNCIFILLTLDGFMNLILRYVFTLAGTAGLGLLIYMVVETFPDTDPVDVLIITIPDIVLFFIAYKTYPAEVSVKKYR
jgi:hypothetical protein